MTHPRTRNPDMKRPLVVGLGEVLWDLLPSGAQLGGAPANFACHARALGFPAAIVSAVGRDALGESVRDRLNRQGVECRGIATREDLPTGTVSVALDDAGKPHFTIHRPAAWDAIPFTPVVAGLASLARAVCFGTLAQRAAPSQATVRRFLAATPPECVRVFDINLRSPDYGPDVIRASLHYATILKINHEELPVLSQLLGLSATWDDAVRELFAGFPIQLVALTRGPDGSILRSRTEEDQHPGIPVTPTDTVGAGDAFTAALTAGYLRGHPLAQINAHANRLAAYVCTQPGATPPLPAELRDSA